MCLPLPAHRCRQHSPALCVCVCVCVCVRTNCHLPRHGGSHSVSTNPPSLHCTLQTANQQGWLAGAIVAICEAGYEGTCVPAREAWCCVDGFAPTGVIELGAQPQVRPLTHDRKRSAATCGWCGTTVPATDRAIESGRVSSEAGWNTPFPSVCRKPTAADAQSSFGGKLCRRCWGSCTRAAELQALTQLHVQKLGLASNLVGDSGALHCQRACKGLWHYAPSVWVLPATLPLDPLSTPLGVKALAQGLAGLPQLTRRS